MPPKKKLRVIDTNQRKITSMLQQGPELTKDAPASADSESAEPENPRFIGISLAVVSVAEVSLAVWR